MKAGSPEQSRGAGCGEGPGLGSRKPRQSEEQVARPLRPAVLRAAGRLGPGAACPRSSASCGEEVSEGTARRAVDSPKAPPLCDSKPVGSREDKAFLANSVSLRPL